MAHRRSGRACATSATCSRTGCPTARSSAMAQRIARRLSRAPPPARPAGPSAAAARPRAVPYRYRSDDIDLDRTIEVLTERPVPEDTDIIVRERMRPRRAVVLIVDVSGLDARGEGADRRGHRRGAVGRPRRRPSSPSSRSGPTPPCSPRWRSRCPPRGCSTGCCASRPRADQRALRADRRAGRAGPLGRAAAHCRAAHRRGAQRRSGPAPGRPPLPRAARAAADRRRARRGAGRRSGPPRAAAGSPRSRTHRDVAPALNRVLAG